MGGVRKHLAQALCFGKVKPVSAMPKIRVLKADGTTAPAQPGVSAAARQVNVGGRVIHCSGVGSNYPPMQLRILDGTAASLFVDQM